MQDIVAASLVGQYRPNQRMVLVLTWQTDQAGIRCDQVPDVVRGDRVGTDPSGGTLEKGERGQLSHKRKVEASPFRFVEEGTVEVRNDRKEPVQGLGDGTPLSILVDDCGVRFEPASGLQQGVLDVCHQRSHVAVTV